MSFKKGGSVKASERYKIPLVTGKQLDAKGCPHCGNKLGTSDLFRRKGELGKKLRACGNIYRHICGKCNNVTIAVSGRKLLALRAALRLDSPTTVGY
jgi:hypothetical protein